jgi:geranylgeranyl diphosphate synthase type I
MGGRLGAPEQPEAAARLGAFGQALGVAFQLRDDLLGIWQAEALGKPAAGDLRRKKMTLPVIAALEVASPADRNTLLDVYTQPGLATEEQIERVMSILERADARGRARTALREHCETARSALNELRIDHVGNGDRADAYNALAAMLDFVASEAV